MSTIASGPALHWRRHGAEQFDAAQVQLAQQAFGLAAGFIQKTLGLPGFVGFGAQQRQVGERRQPRRPALAQGLFGEGKVTLLGQLDQQRVVGQMGLDNHLARLFGASGTARDLHDQLGHALAGAKVTGEQAAIGIQNRHQGHPGEVMALGEHLRADKNARLALLDSGKQLVHRVLARGAVAIDPQHRVVGE